MLPMLLISAALAANPYIGRDADVVVTRLVPAPPSTVYNYLLNLRHQQALWPPECADRWVFGSTQSGTGSTAEVRYRAGRWHRNLSMVLSKATENRRVEMDHLGKKGFITTWTFTDQDRSTEVELHTWVNAPPWPFRKYYFESVQPLWRDCHARTLENLDKAMQATGPLPERSLEPSGRSQ